MNVLNELREFFLWSPRISCTPSRWLLDDEGPVGQADWARLELYPPPPRSACFQAGRQALL